jgi:hypothetical protein
MVTLSAIAIGLGVPAACLYSVVNYGFNAFFASIIAFFAVAMGGAIVIVGITLGGIGSNGDSSHRVNIERERVKNLKAQQVSTLEELESIAEILVEIRDVLTTLEE